MEVFVAEYLGWLENHNRWLFNRLIEYSETAKNRIKASFLFNAYQPRCNRTYKIEKPQIPDNNNPFFHLLYEKIESYNIKRKEKDNLIAVAASDCYVPLLAIGEMFPNSISIAFPQVTLDQIKNRFPQFIDRLSKLYIDKKLDIGVSSYHHSFAPLLTEKLIYQEYSSSLSSFISLVNSKGSSIRERISLHIPECAVSPSLMNSLASVQKDYNIKFITVLDSDYHNRNGFYDIGKVNKAEYFANGMFVDIHILFSNNYFSRKLFSFPPNSEPKETGFWYFIRFFESIAKPQPYPYWEKIKSGETIRFTIHTDAETIGFYQQERIYSLQLMIHLMKNFDIDFAFVSNFSQEEVVKRESIEPLLYKTWDMETNGTARRWIKDDFGSSSQLFLIAKEIIPPILHEISEREQEMDRKERKRIWIAKMRWANALTSCPHWWNKPDSTAGKQFSRDIIQVSKQINALERYTSQKHKEVIYAIKRLEEHPFIKNSLGY